VTALKRCQDKYGTFFLQTLLNRTERKHKLICFSSPISCFAATKDGQRHAEGSGGSRSPPAQAAERLDRAKIRPQIGAPETNRS
jgi:hypothetical protein